MKKLIIFFTLMLTVLAAQAGLFDKQPQFLKAEQAFAFSYEQQDDGVTLHWQIADGYYLYKKELKFNGQNLTIAEPDFPPAEEYNDEIFGNVAIYRDQLRIPLIITEYSANPTLEVNYQGCTKGFCYPPESKLIEISALSKKGQGEQAEGKSAVKNSAILNEEPAEKQTALGSSSPSAEQDKLAQSLLKSKYAVFWFFLLGIGLAFTPCVLPMLPLLSAIVLGQNERPNSVRAF